jgi:dienelactone hydrolase
MGYDPFPRGLAPVGVASGRLRDVHRDGRELPFEVWYPADSRYFGLDLSTWTRDRFVVVPDSPPREQAAIRHAAPAAGRHPLILFSHTSAGHRRQSSFLTTHLASHGYVVAAVDHAGSTAQDLVARAQRVAAGVALEPEELRQRISEMIEDRVPDLVALLETVLAGDAGVTAIDPERIGVIGWSFGGWAALAAPEADGRFGAVVAITPAGSSNPVPGILPVTLTFDWKRSVPVLFLAADRDVATPVPGVAELLERTPSPRAMFVLHNAAHGHFGDEIEDDESCPPEHAHLFTRGLALAHLDHALRGDSAAGAFLADDAEEALRARGIAAHRLASGR